MTHNERNAQEFLCALVAAYENDPDEMVNAGAVTPEGGDGDHGIPAVELRGTFEERAIMTRNAGFLFTIGDQEYQVTIVQC